MRGCAKVSRGYQRLNRFAPVGLSAFTFITLLPYARADYDRAHDGFMLVPALAAQSGMDIHGDVYAPYGPIAPWIQSWFLYLPTSPVLALRLSAILTIAAIVFLMADIGRLRASKSPVTYGVGLWAAVTWVIVSDVWLGGPVRPWSSLFLMLGIVLAAYLSLRSWYHAEAGRWTRSVLFAGTAGFTFGVTIFARVGLGLVLLAAAACCLVCLPWAGIRGRRLLATIAIGTCLGMGVVILALAATGSLTEFVSDTIVGPYQFGVVGSSPLWPFILGVVPVYLPAVVLGAFVLAAIWWMQPRSSPRTLDLVAALGGAAMLGATVIATRFADGLSPVFEYWTSWRALMLFFTCVFVASIAASVVSLTRLLKGGQKRPEVAAWLILGVLSGACLMEVIPDYNGRHIWWSLPIGLVLVYSMVNVVVGNLHPLRNVFTVPLLVFGASSVYYFGAMVHHGVSTRYEIPSGSIASGMFVSSGTLDALVADRRLLDEQLGTDQAIFLTLENDLSVLTGRFESTDRYFSCWAVLPPLVERLGELPPVVVDASADWCEPSSAVGTLLDLGYVLTGRNERVLVYRHPGS